MYLPCKIRIGLSRVCCGYVYFKIDKAQRNQYSMFDVGRSMFDVQSFLCFGLMHVSYERRRWPKKRPALSEKHFDLELS